MAGRILVLDDEENYAEMLQDLLRENNYRVDMATRPERAITQLEEIPYDLVISDYKMPVLDGADLLQKARELYPNLPFILVSGLMNTPELVKVANMSVTLVMEKPLDTETFLRHVARFSKPMTDEEKEQLVNDGQSAVDEAATVNYPEEPRFFSASNFLANRFLQNAWQIANSGKELFILEPVGGDAELAIRDISFWHGNGDMPVVFIELADSDEDAVEQLRGVISDLEKSWVIGVRLNAISDIPRAQQLTETVQREMDASGSVLLAYIVTADEAPAEFEKAVGASGVVLPRICLRPSDLAVYVCRMARMRRMVRISAGRADRSQITEFTPESVYALLSFNWPRNYKQIQEVIHAAVDASGEAPVSLEVLCEAIGQDIAPVTPDSRIAALMEAEQRRYLHDQMEQSGLTAAELAKQLELDSSIQTKDDLRNMPLLRRELGAL